MNRGTLRLEAEMLVEAQKGNKPTSFSPERAQFIFKELQVHQIELEMQHEELQRSYDKLQEAKERYVDLYELAPVGYITLDKKGTILQCNLAATELFGLTKELLYNNPINEFILPDDQDIFYHFRRELMIWSEKKSCELRFIRGEEVFWGRLDSSPVLNHGSDSSTWHIILSDITATKKLHENLTATNEICEREDKENLDLMSTTSLKIRTALNTILGLTEVVLETTQLPGLQTEYLMQSNKVAKQLLTQLEEIESDFQ